MDSDSLHRLAKSLLDSGEAASVEDALKAVRQYGVRLHLGPDVQADPVAQTIALTVINTALRSFMGNVQVDSQDFELTAPGFAGWTLRSFMRWAGVAEGTAAGSGELAAHQYRQEGVAGQHLTVVVQEVWRYGLGKAEGMHSYFAPACVAAGGLAVSGGIFAASTGQSLRGAPAAGPEPLGS